MRVHERKKPLTSFIMPNESFKWDFILDKYAAEDDARREAASKRRTAKRADDGLTRITTSRARNEDRMIVTTLD